MQAQHQKTGRRPAWAFAAGDIPYLKMHCSPDLLTFPQTLCFRNN